MNSPAVVFAKGATCDHRLDFLAEGFDGNE
jgi:hypothetical protein